MEELWRHGVDVGWCVVFREWIGKVFLAGTIICFWRARHLSQCHRMHVHGFGPVLFHSSVGKTFGGVIVNLNWGGWLRVTKFGERGDNGNRVLAV
jgi:hypothetical protein